ncbi:tyrosine-type recombinase/integrase [Thalassobaculum litoreum]|uniref:Site-specific recombinase XerD n=1 Tax=Thalassobaculum litoreum DSM 18839 TaxID=1123362 RepID=A0A8G2BPQ3_9PROT|nr:tyrosine-type recombinase/integrase [Thalassobaculum litoreum]SDG60117.1 Site-specific recombinase XerD [Thalassobaculum litoreum DSM 18839]
MSDAEGDTESDAGPTTLPAPTAPGVVELDPSLDRALIANLGDAGRNNDAALSENTRRSYETGWRQYCAWCRPRYLTPLTEHPEQVATYLASLVPSGDAAARKKLSTVRLRLAALKHYYREAGQGLDWKHPAIRNQMKGLARNNPVLVRQEAVQALGIEDLTTIVAAIDTTWLRGLRDRALILVGYAGALRRSELVAIEADHLQAVDGGYEIWLGTTKTDEGDRDNVCVIAETGTSLCPVRALNDWMERAGIAEGPIFRRVDPWGGIKHTALTAQSVRLILKARAGEAGLDVRSTYRGGKTITAPIRWGGHSLRRGMATAVAEATDGDVTAVQRAGRWKTPVTALRYVEETRRVDRSASALVMGKRPGKA